MIHDSAQDIETPSPGLRLGANGWKHDNWSGDFYPLDLPDDWRLTYYANEFSCVLVPAADWQDEPEPEHWLDEVPETFLFYLQASVQDVQQAQLARTAQSLGSQFGGIVADRPVAGIEPGLQFCHEPAGRAVQGIWTPNHDTDSPLALVSLQQADVRVWRHWLEQFSHRNGGNLTALLVSDYDVNMRRMQQLKALMEMMGF